MFFLEFENSKRNKKSYILTQFSLVGLVSSKMCQSSTILESRRAVMLCFFFLQNLKLDKISFLFQFIETFQLTLGYVF